MSLERSDRLESERDGDTMTHAFAGSGAEGNVSWLMPTGLSGDPLLKRLVDLANLGWRAELQLLSNGTYMTGTLISPSEFRAALASSIQSRKPGDGAFEVLDEMVAEAVTTEDPDPVPLGHPTDVPEPRFIHLAEVTIGADVHVPFMRLRLPAVSGFWLTAFDRGRLVGADEGS